MCEGWFGCRFDVNARQHRSSVDTFELLFPHQAAVTKGTPCICVISLLHDVCTTTMLEEKSVSPLRTARGIKADQHGVGEKNEDGVLITLFP